MLFPALLFGISASLDALLVGVSYGIRKIRIRLWQNLTISLITLLGTCLSVGLGHRLSPFLPEIIRQYAGSLILVLLGLYYIAKWGMALLKAGRRKTSPLPLAEQSADFVTAAKPAPDLKPAEVFALSLTLSLNNVSAGLSASLAGLTLIPAAVSTLICSILFLFCGNRLGGYPLLQLAGCATDPLSGILLIGLGLVQLFL